MLPTSPLFSPGAMNPTPGMAMSPLLQGYGSQQNMQNDFTNTALNQQSQQIQNDSAANTLQQQLLDNPNLAAARQVTAGNTAVQQSLLDSGQQLASQGAQLDAKGQAAIASMSDSKLEVLKNKGAAFLAADEYLKQDPSAEMPGSAGNKHLHGILSEAGVGGMPDVIGPQEINFIKARAASAPNTLQFIQQTQLQKQKTAGEAGIEQQKTTSAEKMAAGQQATERYKAETMANAQKTLDNVSAKILTKYNADPDSVNSREIAQVQANLVKNVGFQQQMSISAQMAELKNLDSDPKAQAKARNDILMNNVPGYAEMEDVRLKKMQQEAQSKGGAAAPAQVATPAAGPVSDSGNTQNKPVANATTWAAAKSGDVLWNADQKRYVTK